MSEYSRAPAAHRETASPSRSVERRLWFGILGAPFAWTLHELVGSAVVGRRCAQEGLLETWQWATIIGVSVLAVAIAGAAAWSAFRVFRELSPAKLSKAEGWDRVEFMAIAGIIVSLSLGANIVMMGVMPAIVSPCTVTT